MNAKENYYFQKVAIGTWIVNAEILSWYARYFDGKKIEQCVADVVINLNLATLARWRNMLILD